MTKGDAIRAAHRSGEGGYATLARRFGIGRDTARRYIKDATMTDPVRMSCGRKQRHATAEAAGQALARMIADRGTERERICEVYACEHCAGFHVGRPAFASAKQD